MISKPSYKPAELVAEAVKFHFAQHHTAAQYVGITELAAIPTVPVIGGMIDAGFWASLRREEGRSPKISLAFLSPDDTTQPLVFAEKIPLSPEALTKLAPAVERPGIHLGVWIEKDELFLWGATRDIPGLCFVLEVVEPGLLVIKHRRLEGFGKYTNVAVLNGDKVKIIDESEALLPGCPKLVASLLGFTLSQTRDGSLDVLVQLAAAMRSHCRGGSLLVVPAGSDSWHNSIVHPIHYAVAPAFSGLADLMRQEENHRESKWQLALRRATETVAGLTAVDGATIINDQYEVLAFGAKIRRPENGSPVDKIIVTEPVVDGGARIMHPSQHGGTRHLSAAQFVYSQRDALALVASQDGRFTIFAWSATENLVHAHRVETLLL